MTLNLSDPFIMPAVVMLRTEAGDQTVIGGCHMAVPIPENGNSRIGGCHMAVPIPSNQKLFHREAVELG